MQGHSTSKFSNLRGMEISTTASVTEEMEGKERTIRRKSAALNAGMQSFDVSEVTLKSVKSGECDFVIDKIRELCENLVHSIEDFIMDNLFDMTPEWMKSLRDQISVIKRNTYKYQMGLIDKMHEVKMNSSTSTTVVSASTEAAKDMEAGI